MTGSPASSLRVARPKATARGEFIEMSAGKGGRMFLSRLASFDGVGPLEGVATLTGAAVPILAVWLLTGAAAAGQSATVPSQPAAQPSQTSSALLQPALSELGSTIAELHIAKWKAPGPVKDEAQGNAASIQRDLQNTLPGLLSQADAAPQSVAGTFAVYRNLDALYEVLLRVSGTAELAAPDVEAANLAHSLMTLDAGRRALADAIVSASRAQEAALLLARQPPPPAAPPPAPATTVISDGPVSAAPAHRKAKPKPKPAPQTTPPA